MRESGPARSQPELGALAPSPGPPPRRARWTSSRAIRRECGQPGRAPACCRQSPRTWPIFWGLVPCIALVWAWLLSGPEAPRPTDRAEDVISVEVSLTDPEPSAEGSDRRASPALADAIPVDAPLMGPARRDPLLRALDATGSPATPGGSSRPRPAGPAGVVPTSTVAAGSRPFELRRRGGAPPGDVARAPDGPAGDAPRAGDLELLPSPAPPAGRDCFRLCGRGPPSQDLIS